MYIGLLAANANLQRYWPNYLVLIREMSLSHAPVYADNVVGQITTASNINSLNNALKTGISKDSRETQLVSFLSNGQDPLTVLDVEAHTLGVLYILWVLICILHFVHSPYRDTGQRESAQVSGALHRHPGKWFRISVAVSTQNKRHTLQIVVGQIDHHFILFDHEYPSNKTCERDPPSSRAFRKCTSTPPLHIPWVLTAAQ